MECKEINSLLIDFVDKNLNQEQTEVVQKHLESCKSCRQEVEELMVVMGEIKQTGDENPSANLRSNFMQMIEAEKRKHVAVEAKPLYRQNIQQHQHRIRFMHPIYQVAAGFAILIAGMMLGLMINKSNTGTNKAELSALKSEVNSMKQMVMLSKLNQPSASSRIQAVNYIEDISFPDQKVVDALIETMNTDDNSNVRLAATTALSNFADDQRVRTALIESLATQDDPMVQITLINIMVGLREVNAKKYIQRIATNDNTNENVKLIAQKSLDILT